MAHGVDPVTREIVKNALAAAADEMAIALYRTAYSTIVRDCLDYSTSLCDGEGEMIAQGVTIPLHLGSVPFAMETLLAKYGDNMEEGDVFILNDPFEGGMHIPDIFIIKPIYWEGARIAFSVATAHHLDLGGRVPGSSACDNTEIFQEGTAHPVAQAVPAGRAGRVAVRDGAGERPRAGDDAGGPARAGGGLSHRRARVARAGAPLRTGHLPRVHGRPDRLH